MYLGDLSVSDYKSAFFLGWRQSGSSEEQVVTSSSWHVTQTKCCGRALLCV